MGSAYANEPWNDPQYASPYIKWTIPGQDVEGRVAGYGQGEFPADGDKPASPYAIAYLDTAMGPKELALSLVDLKEQWFGHKPQVGDLVKVRYIREADKKKLFDVQVTRAQVSDPAQLGIAQNPAAPETRF